MKFVDFQSGRKRREPVDINLTSLVDIIFNLLLFFMLTASIAAQPGIDVDLPEADSSETNKDDNALVIVITQNQEILVDDKSIDVKQLNEKIQQNKSLKNFRVIIKADKLAAHGNVVEILDLVRKNGIYALSIATDSK